MGIKETLRPVASFLLILSGLASLVMTFFVTVSRLHAVDTNRRLIFVAAALMVIYSLLNILCGILSIVNQDRRNAASKYRPLVQFSVILAIIQIVISGINGLIIYQLVVLLVCGIILPEFFVIIYKGTAKTKSYL